MQRTQAHACAGGDVAAVERRVGPHEVVGHGSADVHHQAATPGIGGHGSGSGGYAVEPESVRRGVVQGYVTDHDLVGKGLISILKHNENN